MMLKKINIIIIDDQINMLEPLSDILQDYGYNVTIVDDGFKGIEIIKKHHFDIALIDVQMPGINGVDTFREIKKSRACCSLAGLKSPRSRTSAYVNFANFWVWIAFFPLDRF